MCRFQKRTWMLLTTQPSRWLFSTSCPLQFWFQICKKLDFLNTIMNTPTRHPRVCERVFIILYYVILGPILLKHLYLAWVCFDNQHHLLSLEDLFGWNLVVPPVTCPGRFLKPMGPVPHCPAFERVCISPQHSNCKTSTTVLLQALADCITYFSLCFKVCYHWFIKVAIIHKMLPYLIVFCLNLSRIIVILRKIANQQLSAQQQTELLPLTYCYNPGFFSKFE